MSDNEKSKHVLSALSKLAKTSGLSVNELRVILALERMVARIQASKALAEKLLFKGGFVLLKAFDSPRFTRDLDVLAYNVSKEKIKTLLTQAIAIDLDDGFCFADVNIEELIDQGQYGGLRINVPFQIGALPKEPNKLKKLSRIHLDIGFGDTIIGKPLRLELKALIEGERDISWVVYPLESIFAEKLETLVSRGSANSRAKDLYDLVMIYKNLEKAALLQPSIENTFSKRGTPIPSSFYAHVTKLDFTILANSWKTVQLQGGKLSFEECLEQLKHVLKALDKLIVA